MCNNNKASVEQYNRALRVAVDIIEDLTGSCPLDIYDYYCDCENCDDDFKKCWTKYLFYKSS